VSTADFCLARAAFGLGDLDRAAAIYQALVVFAQEIGDEYNLATASFGLGVVRAIQGDDTGALTLHAGALATYRGLGELWNVAMCLEAVAAVACRRGPAQQAARFLGAAEGLRRRLAAPVFPPERAALDQVAAATRAALGETGFAGEVAAGAHAPLDDIIGEACRLEAAPTGAAPVQLTPRERDVLRLLVAGCTDPQIAAALAIGPRTVQSYVGAILTKLGLHTRTAAVAHAVRQGLV